VRLIATQVPWIFSPIKLIDWLIDIINISFSVGRKLATESEQHQNVSKLICVRCLCPTACHPMSNMASHDICRQTVQCGEDWTVVDFWGQTQCQSEFVDMARIAKLFRSPRKRISEENDAILSDSQVLIICVDTHCLCYKSRSDRSSPTSSNPHGWDLANLLSVNAANGRTWTIIVDSSPLTKFEDISGRQATA